MSALAEALLRYRFVSPEALHESAQLRKHRDERWIEPIPNGEQSSTTGTAALEGEALQRGFVFSKELHERLRALTPGELTTVGRWLLEKLDEQLGGHVDHVPLFRWFPQSVPTDTEKLYVDRMFAYLVQEEFQPCVLCGAIGSVNLVSPCAHLVCTKCWDGSDYSACPICHQRIDLDDPFLLPTAGPPVVPAPRKEQAPHRLRLLTLADAESAREIAVRLTARPTPLTPSERADLPLLMRAIPDLEWIPAVFAVRETKALVLVHALDVLSRAADIEQIRSLLDAHVDTATDVLRLLTTMMGGDPGLRTRPPQRVSLRRTLRRELLARMDDLHFPLLAEDLARHPEAWKRMAEGLHPFEHAHRHPNVALAFAVLRKTSLYGELGHFLRAAAKDYADCLLVRENRLQLVTIGTRVEAALANGDGEIALALLRSRPGELFRRLVHLAKVTPLGPLVEVAREVVPRVSPGVLFGTLGRLRTPAGITRLFLVGGGRGERAATWIQEPRPDELPLPDGAIHELAEVITGELLRRAHAQPRLRTVLLDDGLAELHAPMGERTTSTSLVRMTRGSTQPLPDTEHLRLFVHWAEPAGERVDLDLSVAVFDERWDFVGMCSYTNLRLGGAAVHSGDLTSAPEPLGASEFVNIDPMALRRMGGRYLLPIVFSYNDVPFENLVRGFAGAMASPTGLFDPLAVEQRFDLAGTAKVLLPFVVDLWTRRMRWVDVNLGTGSGVHTVERHGSRLAKLGAALEDVYGLGDRVTLWEIACWNAAARADVVAVRRNGAAGAVGSYIRRSGESIREFADRVSVLTPPDGEGSDAILDLDLAVLVQANLTIEENAASEQRADVYALYPWGLDAARIRLIDAGDLVEPFAAESVTRRSPIG